MKFINYEILKQVKNLCYIVKPIAPSTEKELFNSTSLVIWSQQSENTIYNDKLVNYAFRAWHDALHLNTRLDFSIENEIELGRIQASKMTSCLMQDLVFCEIAGQALYYKEHGIFVKNQVEFTKNYMLKKGWVL